MTHEYVPPEAAREFLANVERNEGSDQPFGRYWPIVKWATIGAILFCALAYGGVFDRLMNWWLERGG